MAKWFCVTSYDNVIPKAPGCYAIFKYNLDNHSRTLLYIGTAQNLSIRLERHEVKRVLLAILNYPEIVYIKVKIMMNKQNRLTIEQSLIKRLRPPINYA